MTTEKDHFVESDISLVQAAKGIKVLSSLGWDDQVCIDFLTSVDKGNPKLPVVEYPKFDYSKERALLQKIMNETPDDHPVGWYISKTAQSYQIAAMMLENLGKPAFLECSLLLYGKPMDHIGHLSNLSLADDFISVTDDFLAALSVESSSSAALSASESASIIKVHSDLFFKNHSIKIVIDDQLNSKATAGSERVRLRGGATFTRNEIDQLLNHEIYVHAATMLNGRRQPYLKSMGLGSPRTTGTQEGLATFSELISGTMDLDRLRRIALRIKAIQNALDGANFLEVFDFFKASGQSPVESFKSTARIFRGGNVNGSHVFTKDVVYLKGLVSVHSFLRKSTQRRKIDYPQRLFSGRLTVGDIIRLEESFDDGWVSKGEHIAPWASNQQGLAAYLCYNAFSNKLRLDDLKLEDFIEEGSHPSDWE